MTFNNQYNLLKQLVVPELNLIQDNMVNGININTPLKKTIIDFLQAPSKRIRPLFVLLYLKAIGEKISETQIELLTVIELIHNASLIHDDVIDESKTRRGNKTLSDEFNSKLAVISGDYLLTLAFNSLIKLDYKEITQKYIDTIQKMCLGEIKQDFNRFKIGTLEDYIEKTKDKTAYLFETGLFSALKLASIPEEKITQACNYALNVGIAFQIRDDIINFTQTDLLKPIGNDFQDGIYNAPVILGYKEDNYKSGIEKSQSLLNNYIDNAKQHLNNIPNNKYKLALEDFLELLKNV